MTRIIVSAKWIVTGIQDRHTPHIISDGAVLVHDGIIEAIGMLNDMKQLAPQVPVSEFPHHVMLPGFVNSHHHVGLTPLQVGTPDLALELWIAYRSFERRVDFYLDTLYSAFEMLASGITTVAHINGWIPGSYDEIYRGSTRVLEAYRKIGMRASFSVMARDQNRLVYESDDAFCARLPNDLGARLAERLRRQSTPISESLDLFDQLHSDNRGQCLTRIQLAPANLHWCSDEALLALEEKSRSANVPMHMHLLETSYQKEYGRRRSNGKTAVRHLHDLGILSSRLTLGHGVWLNEEDIEIAAQTGVCICHTAKAEKVDIIGLSGLITPSLDEMVHVAAEMEREGFDIPLLIGGATTSRVHTAVKIHPRYDRGQTVYVTDASRAVGVVGSLLSADMKPGYVETLKAEYRKVADAHARSEAEKQRLPLAKARENAFKADWSVYRPKTPSFLGTRVWQDWDLADLARYIDWTPFFQTWELKGVYPKILDDEKQGLAARQLFADAQAMLEKIIAEKWFTPKAVVGFWPAGTVGDDIRLFTDEARNKDLATFFTLRQQLSKRDGRPNVALSDFVAPVDSGKPDYLGGFVVTAGIGEIAIAERFERANDDYNSILVKALADRFAEAFAERMHEYVRKELWAYAPDETFSPTDLIGEPYAGIRPAPGYPAQPDHTEKTALFRLLDAEKQIGVELTESFAMWPGSSVSGLYIASPESYYFGVAKVERDQVEDYARRKGMTVMEVERWLGPVLNYVPVTARENAA